MECLTAQGLISDALDRAPLDAQQLAEAKQHCLGCPTCSVFVRTLLLVRSTPAPTPSADLVDRVMAAIRAEDAHVKQAAAEIAAESTSAAVDDAAAGVVAGTDARENAPAPDPVHDGRIARLDAARRWMRGLSRQEAITWASAAVIFVAAAGIAASAGVRILTAPPVTDSTLASNREAATEYGATSAAPEAADSAVTIAPSSEPAGSYITIQNVAYILSGPSTIATDGLVPAGTVTSALGSGSGPKSHPAFKADDPDRLYVLDGANGQLLAFDRVVRTHNGIRYQLTSDPLSDFGQWPNLPANITEPVNPDGSPTFTRLIDDQSGTPTYRIAGGSELSGIAVGPGSPQGDPALGNPNWTWWTPAR